MKTIIWKNGCGASVGRHRIHFTGLPVAPLNFTNDPLVISLKKCEWIYVDLKLHVGRWACPNLIAIANRGSKQLVKAVKQAQLYRKQNVR